MKWDTILSKWEKAKEVQNESSEERHRFLTWRKGIPGERVPQKKQKALITGAINSPQNDGEVEVEDRGLFYFFRVPGST